MSFQRKPNNVATDFSLTTPKLSIGPFFLCAADRAKTQIIDLGIDGCTINIHLCDQCRAINKSIGYNVRIATRNPAKDVKEGTADGTMEQS